MAGPSLWLHPTAAGRLDLPVVVCYEPPPPAPPLLKFRTLRLAAGTRVMPSLSITTTVLTAATNPAARVIRLTCQAATATTAGSPSYALRTIKLVRSGGGGGSGGGAWSSHFFTKVLYCRFGICPFS